MKGLSLLWEDLKDKYLKLEYLQTWKDSDIMKHPLKNIKENYNKEEKQEEDKFNWILNWIKIIKL